jgi:2-polyprenyl-6-methoxyphenol hydroxylase-like FAD-dependent oxidoreductase
MRSPHARSSARRAAARPHPRRALVLGGSLAGLLAARVLAEHVEEVVVVDRDDLDADLDAPRRGVPQSRHTHGLLVGGTEGIERILPGFGDEIVARGGLRADLLTEARWLIGDHLLSREASGMPGLLTSRTLLESQVRRRVAAVPNVRFLGGYAVDGLLTGGGPADRARVTGAVLVPASREEGTAGAGRSDRQEVLADLVVDATGRGSRAPKWLADLGYEAPPETTFEAQVRYVTRHFADRPGVLPGLRCDVVGTRPDDGRGGVALRQEGGRWTVTLVGQFGEEAPMDLDGYLAYARSLPTSGLAEVVERCEPVSEPVRTGYPASRWRHWEKLRRRPEGLVVIGDAVCSFNPVYGQGMSSAAAQAVRLGELLGSGGLDDLAARSARALAQVVATPWTLSTGPDRRFPGLPEKPLPERLVDRYVDRLLAVATEDTRLTLAFGRVLNLLAAPTSLLAPSVAWRVLGPGSGAIVARARVAATRRAEETANRTAGATVPVTSAG